MRTVEVIVCSLIYCKGHRAGLPLKLGRRALRARSEGYRMLDRLHRGNNACGERSNILNRFIDSWCLARFSALFE